MVASIGVITIGGVIGVRKALESWHLREREIALRRETEAALRELLDDVNHERESDDASV